MTGEVSPSLGGRSFTATAEIERQSAKTQGAIFALGSAHNGIAFYVLGDRLVFDYNLFTKHCKAISDIPVPVGRSTIAVALEKTGDNGRATISIDGKPCGAVEIPKVLRMISSTGMDAGRDPGSPVSDDYPSPFDFGGRILRLVFETPDRGRREQAEAQKAEANAAMARQ